MAGCLLMDEKSDDAETEKQQCLHDVDPNRAAHSAKENIPHHDQRDDRAAKRIRNSTIGKRFENYSAADDADDQIRNDHRGGDEENERAGGGAFPAITEEGDLRRVAEDACPQTKAGYR